MEEPKGLAIHAEMRLLAHIIDAGRISTERGSAVATATAAAAGSSRGTSAQQQLQFL